MDIMDIIQARYSCRHYLDKPIEPDKLHKILEAARLAPSARNYQDWRFVIVRETERKQQLARAANNQMFIAQAGAIIVGCSNNDHVMRCAQPIGPIDLAIAMEHMCLQATESGLATCWIGSFYPDQVRDILGIPKTVQIIELLSLGYPADQGQQNTRDPLDSIVCYETWQFR